MDETEFDKFADEYNAILVDSLHGSGEGPQYFAEYKIIDIARHCATRDSGNRTTPMLLDFGAGNGSLVPYVNKHFPQGQLTCLDVSRRSLEVAEKRFPSLAQYVHFDGMYIPCPDEYFDIAFAACVFHHIEHDKHISLLKELNRVVRPGGSLFIFEHNPYNPLTVRVVNNCVFDENAHLIRARDMKRQLLAAGFNDASIHYRIFFPRALRVLRPLEKAMTWLPLGAQYYVLANK